MELPSLLRGRLDDMLAGIPLASLQSAADRLSTRYRAETRDGALHLGADLAVEAYLATRLPATYAAVRTSFEMASAALPDFTPRTLLDIGAGPGTALWATLDCWPSLARATMVEASPNARSVGQQLADGLGVETQWLDGDATGPLMQAVAADLVTMAYVLDELPENAMSPLIRRLWALAGECLVVIEPGTPRGWKRILAVRDTLVAAGAHLAAPCPHEAPCPLTAPDWCHFSRKVARSRLHRMVKRADVPWEDEKFIYMVASRSPAARRPARVIAPPRVGSGQVRLKLCQPDGSVCDRLVTRRDGQLFKDARRVDWGDPLTAAPWRNTTTESTVRS